MLQNRILQINDNGKQDNLYSNREDINNAFYKETKRIDALVLWPTDNYNLNKVVILFLRGNKCAVRKEHAI